jgi:hypothetical protein
MTGHNAIKKIYFFAAAGRPTYVLLSSFDRLFETVWANTAPIVKRTFAIQIRGWVSL